jgi:hypothetical protein
MKAVFLGLLALSLHAGVTCKQTSDNTPGTWSSDTCSGITRPYTYTVTATSGSTGSVTELQAALNDAWRGDTVLMTAGVTWTPTADNSPIYIRGCKSGASGYLTIDSTEFAKLPADGTRITPAYQSLLPIIEAASGIGRPILGLAAGVCPAEHVKVRGVRFQVTPMAFSSTSASYAGPFIMIGSQQQQTCSSTGTNQPCAESVKQTIKTFYPETAVTATFTANGTNDTLTVAEGTWATAGMYVRISSKQGGNSEYATVASSTSTSVTFEDPLVNPHAIGESLYIHVDQDVQTPNDIVVQHVLIRNESRLDKITRFIQADSRTTTIRDSFLDGPMNYGSADTQVITGNNGPGPTYIYNNYIGGGSEPIMFGGSFPGYDVTNTGSSISYNFIEQKEERTRIGPRTNTWSGSIGPARKRMAFKGLYLFPGTELSVTSPGSGGQSDIYGWYRATNTGEMCETEPVLANWAVAVGATVADCGVTWERRGASNKPLPKNLFELKSAENLTLTLNGLSGWFNMSGWNTTQNQAVNIKSNNQPPCNSTLYGYSHATNGCYGAKTAGFTMTRNYFKNIGSGWFSRLSGGSETDIPRETGGDTIEGNLVELTEPVAQTQSTGLFALGGIARLDSTYLGYDAGAAYQPYQGNLTIRRNSLIPVGNYLTIWDANSADVRAEAVNVIYNPSSFADTNGVISFMGNVLPAGRTYTFYMQGGTETATAFNKLLPCSSPPCNDKFYKNIIFGSKNNYGSTRPYWPGSILNNCSSGTALTTQCPPPVPDFTGTQHDGSSSGTFGGVSLLRNRTLGDHRISGGHTWARNGLDGSDIGADPNLVPRIRNLNVTATDRLALFRYVVTQPIAEIPCVVEVHDSPDMEGNWTDEDGTVHTSTGYAGELSAISTHYGKDSDAHDRNPRSPGKIRRSLVIGHTVNLTPDTTYYYRLHCGGDMESGSFTTAAEKTGTTTLSVSRASLAAATWGYEYSRATDEITDDAAMSCASNTCTATATRGRLVYWRAGTGPVQTVAIQ